MIAARRYKQKLQLASRLLTSPREPPLKQAADWILYAAALAGLRGRGSDKSRATEHLKPAAQGMGLVELLCADILLFLVGALAVFLGTEDVTQTDKITFVTITILSYLLLLLITATYFDSPLPSTYKSCTCESM